MKGKQAPTDVGYLALNAKAEDPIANAFHGEDPSERERKLLVITFNEDGHESLGCSRATAQELHVLLERACHAAKGTHMRQIRSIIGLLVLQG